MEEQPVPAGQEQQQQQEQQQEDGEDPDDTVQLALELANLAMGNDEGVANLLILMAVLPQHPLLHEILAAAARQMQAGHQGQQQPGPVAAAATGDGPAAAAAAADAADAAAAAEEADGAAPHGRPLRALRLGEMVALLSLVPPEQQKQELGELVFPEIEAMQPDLAGKITGMLLELMNAELVDLYHNRTKLFLHVQEAVEVLRLNDAVPAGAQVPVPDLSAWLPAAQRPVLTVRQLAALAAGPNASEFRDTLAPRFFYQVYQPQPLLSRTITEHALLRLESAVERGSEGWGSLRRATLHAEVALRYLDSPAQIAELVNAIVQGAGLRTRQLSGGQQLRSDEEVLAAAAALQPEGEAVPWAPASHARFPPVFRRATRAMLLCKARARRLVVAATGAAGDAGSQEESSSGSRARSVSSSEEAPAWAALLDSLPDELVQPILSLAAEPVQEWVDVEPA